MASRKTSYPTIKDVAKLAQVSPATVSSVLRGTKNVSDISRHQIEEAIAQLGYRPNAVAQALRTQRSHTVGLIIPDMVNPFYADIAQGVTDQARDLGYGVFLMTAGETFEDLRQAAADLASRQVEGLVITSVGLDYPLTPGSVETMPYVLVNRSGSSLTADYVGIDNRAGAREVVQYLCELGHQRIAFIGGMENSSASRDRIEGFREAMSELNQPMNPQHVVFAHLQYQEAFELTQELMSTVPRPTAIFAADDMMALGALQGLQSAGIQVPREVSVMGFDGIWTTALQGIQLSTVIQPRYDLGSLAVTLLHDRIQGYAGPARRRLLEYQLAKRNTTAAVWNPVQRERGG